MTPEHVAYLETSAAISAEVALAAGIRSASTVADLPEWARARLEEWPGLADAVPGLVFPWRSPGGVIVEQIRPDRPLIIGADEHKYLWPKGQSPILLAGREDPDADTVLIVEGTKQTFAAASWAPAGVAVYGIGGCRNWTDGGVPLEDLSLVAGRKVVVALDADVATNPEVYTAGERLRDALELEGAATVLFARNPGAGSAGLDDILAARRPETRTEFIDRLIAKAKPKPADRRPAARKPRQATRVRAALPEVDPGRPVLDVDGDRLVVINELSRVLLERWNATRLFNHGGALVQIIDVSEPGTTGVRREMSPITKGVYLDIIQETALTGRYAKDRDGEEITFVPGWPDDKSIEATLSRVRMYVPLTRIASAPFVRPDGSICQTAGYDDASATMLIMDDALSAVVVPEAPTDSEIAMARKLIMEEWLGDFSFPTSADRANVLALVLTPFVRGHMDLVPLAVIDGLQMGSGKNLLADVIQLVALGLTSEPLPWPGDDEERRKLITGAFRTGADLFLFDEAHLLEGASLARALTSITYRDRLLGGNNLVAYPNRVTWVALGNNVDVEGDIARRVYRVAIHPEEENPQDRPASSFRQGEYAGPGGSGLKGWTRDHRADLVRACLTLVRAWFARGCPKPSRGVSFGSFEVWERILGGIVEVAGLPDFLGNLKTWRSETNFEIRYWEAHVHWLRRTFGAEVFVTAQVRSAMIRDTDHEHPPGLPVDPASPTGDYNRRLGQAYAKYSNRWLNGLKLVKAPEGRHGHTSGWMVIGPADLGDADLAGPDSPVTPDSRGERGGTGGTPEPPRTREKKTLCTARIDDARVFFHAGLSGVEVPPVPPVPPDAVSIGTDADGPGQSGLDQSGDKGDLEAAPGQSGLSEIRPNDQKPDEVSEVDILAQLRDLPPPDDEYTRKAEALGHEVISLFHDAGPLDDPAVAPSDPGGDYPRVDWSRPLHYPSPVNLPAGVVAIDLETDSADRLWSSGPEFLRLMGLASFNGATVTPNVLDEVRRLRQASMIVGHNIMGFDLPALARHAKLDITALADQGRIFDTMLAAVLTDPPEGNPKPAQVMRAYSLDNYAKRKLGDDAGKSLDLKALARKWGGFGRIPQDHKDYVDYCAHDAVLSAQLAAGMRTNTYVKREHRIAALAAQIRANGFRVDVDLLASRLGSNRTRRADLLAELTSRYGLPTTKKDGKPCASPHATEEGKAAIVQAFADLGVDLPLTPKGHPSFGSAALDQVRDRHAHDAQVIALVDVVSSLNGVRSVYETVETYRVGDRVHPDITMLQASGRWSTTKPGLTVLGKRGGKHHERDILIPEPGHVIISADLSQVDARVVAAFAQDPAYLDLFEPGRDSHLEIALAVWGDPSRREHAKPLGHGWNYGMGLKRLAALVGDHDTAAQFDAAMKDRFRGLVAWKQEIYERACAGEILSNGFGRPLRCAPGREWTQAPALTGQSGARDVMMEGLLRLPAEVRPMLRAVIHDEVVLSVPEDVVDDVEKSVIDALSFEWCPYPDGRPVRIEAGLGERRGRSWGEVYEK